MAIFNRIIDRLLFYLLSAALAGLVGICLLQVVARYVFSASFTWAEEISVVLLIWATWGAACLALKQGIHLNVRILPERLTKRTNLIVRLFLNALALPFLSIVIMASRPVLDAMRFQTLMSLPEISINIMYASVPAGCTLMVYYMLRLIVEDAKTLASLVRRER
jgi:TRAP-type C4-dicarboxylate transport system permease small subunit